jgi:hypothetical protein
MVQLYFSLINLLNWPNTIITGFLQSINLIRSVFQLDVLVKQKL